MVVSRHTRTVSQAYGNICPDFFCFDLKILGGHVVRGHLGAKGPSHVLEDANPHFQSDYGGSHTTWYTNTAAQTQYRAYIKAVVSRYITSTAVFAWELANEPRCQGCSVDVIYKWAADTSAYIKSLDSNHMVTLGDEGFNPSAGDGSYPYQTSEGMPPITVLVHSTC